MISRLLTFALLLGSMSTLAQDSDQIAVELKPEILEDIQRRIPGAVITKTSVRSNAYRARFTLGSDIIGGISYTIDGETFVRYDLTYEVLPDELASEISKYVNLDDVIISRYIVRLGHPPYYAVRTKTGGLILDNDMKQLEHGIVLDGLASVPAPIVNHLQSQYENLTIKETGIMDNHYYSRIEFKAGAVYGQPALVRYTSDFKWVDTSFYFWDLTRLPIDIYLALEEYGGIEAVLQARQFFPSEGETFFKVDLKEGNDESVYFNHLFEAVESPE